MKFSLEEILAFSVWVAENHYLVNTDEEFPLHPRWYTSTAVWVAKSDIELLKKFVKEHYGESERAHEILNYIKTIEES